MLLVYWAGDLQFRPGRLRLPLVLGRNSKSFYRREEGAKVSRKPCLVGARNYLSETEIDVLKSSVKSKSINRESDQTGISKHF